MSSDEENSDDHIEVFREDMRVFLRLRPMNRLEQSRRSKNCIELHEDTTVITVDSPLEGEYDFVFDHVFEEYATQEEVYDQALADVPRNLLQGFNCSVICYGQTGTGKTHTMLGVNGGSEGLLFKSKRDMTQSMAGSVRESQSQWEDEPSELTQSIIRGGRVPEKEDEDMDPEAEGMIPRTISALFELIRQSPPTIEYTIRCSFVEIYLEKILDLLHPQGSGVSLAIEDDGNDDAADKAAGSLLNARIKGASELCCFDASDVCALLARGNACRTMSSTEMNTESSRSHAIFVLRVEQRDIKTDTWTESILNMVDLAGSEHGQQRVGNQANKRASMVLQRSRSSRQLQGTSSVQVEAAMINRSLSALSRMVRTQLENQRGGKHLPIGSVVNLSKLTKLLRPSFGGNCMTTLILTASPSSYNITETMNTIKFGQRCRKIVNNPQIIQLEKPKVYRKKLQEEEKKNQDATALLRALAKECLAMRDSKSKADTALWDSIEDLAAQSSQEEDDEKAHYTVTVRRLDPESNEETAVQPRRGSTSSVMSTKLQKVEDQLNEMENKLLVVMRQKEEAENQITEMQSELAVLRTQNENLTTDKKRNAMELVDAKNEIQMLSQRKLEVEHNLRTSQFRENEAIVFLRHFRKFYRNVLKDKAAHGGGTVSGILAEITDRVPNAPDLKDLRDIDNLLFESGLIEEHEIGENRAPPNYTPSRDALLRSAAGAQRSVTAEAEMTLSGQATAITQQETQTPDGASTFGSEISSIRKITLSLPTGELDAISEMGEGGVSQIGRPTVVIREPPTIDDAKPEESVAGAGNEDTTRAGADAGAGQSVPGNDSILSGAQMSYAHSISRAPSTGMMVTRRQKLLRTPSGRLTIMREKDLEKELAEVSDKCIKLQTALNEEKAVVDALTNKSGGLSKKKLAQEAIQLRQQLEKKNESLLAIAWKMNELNIMNKTNDEKMLNREQHVLYLEEQLVELQNNNQRIAADRIENERKLREEIENLREVVDGMTVPLWQFGESHISQKPLASRIMVPVMGGEHDDHEMHLPQRRMSDGDTDPGYEFDEDEDDEEESESGSESGSEETESGSEEDSEEESDSVDDQDTYDENSVGSRSFMSSSVMSRSVVSRPQRAAQRRSVRQQKKYSTASTQTDPVPEPEPREVFVEKRREPGIDASAQTDSPPEIFRAEAGIQTDPEPEVEKFEVGVQVEVEAMEVSIQTDPPVVEEDKSIPTVTTECSSQTDPVRVLDLVETEHAYVQTEEVETESTYVQTDEVETENAYIQTDEVKSENVYIQTEEVDLRDTAIQTDPVDFASKVTKSSTADRLVTRRSSVDAPEETTEDRFMRDPPSRAREAEQREVESATTKQTDSFETKSQSIEQSEDMETDTDSEESEQSESVEQEKEPPRPNVQNPKVQNPKMQGGKFSKSPIADRFMLDDDRLGGKNRTPVASRFMLGEAPPTKSPSSAKRRNLLHDRAASPLHQANARRGSHGDDVSSIIDGGLEEDDYDNLGKRWGMSKDDIAADTKVLHTQREPNLLGDRKHSEDDEEKDEFDFTKSPEQPKRAAYMEEIVSPDISQSPSVNLKHRASSFMDDHQMSSLGSINDDDFDRMMDETAKALAAAEELLPSEDESAVGESSLEDSRLDESHRTEDYSIVDEETERTRHRSPIAYELTTEMISGGRSNRYIPRRFVEKSVKIRPGVLKEAKHGLYPEPEDSSVTSAELQSRSRGSSQPLPPVKTKRSKDRSRSRSRPVTPYDDRKKKKKKKTETSTKKTDEKKKKKKKADKKEGRARSKTRG